MIRSILAVFLLFVPAITAQEKIPFEPERWTVELTGPGSGVQHLGNGVALLYRPHLLSKEDWKSGAIGFEWQPSVSALGDDGKTYGDHLVVLLSSKGEFRKERSFEALTGIAVRLDAVTGDVRIQRAIDGISFEDIKVFKGSGPFSSDNGQKIIVQDDGKAIAVYLNGKKVLDTEIPDADRKGKRWGFYNREPVGPGEKVSKLRNLKWS